jgi:hypothetical protein
MNFVNTTGASNSMLFSSNQIPNASTSCGGHCTSYQNGGGYGFSGDQSIPGFRLPEVKSYLNVGVNSDTNLGASKQYIPNTISGGARRHKRRTHRMRYLRGGANDIFYGFTGVDSSNPAFRGSYPPMTLGNNASVGSVGGRRARRGRYNNLAKSKKMMAYMGGNIPNYDSKNTFYGFNGEKNNNISLFKGSYAPVSVGDNDIFSIGGSKHRKRHSRNKSKSNSKYKVHKRKNNKTRKNRIKKMKMNIPMAMSMRSIPMLVNNNMNNGSMKMQIPLSMPMSKSKKNMRSNLFKSLIGGRRK